MKITKIKDILLIGAALLIAECTTENITTGQGRDADSGDPVGLPVLFSVGNENNTQTRAAVPYMAENGRFVCTMYYHATAGDTDDSDFDIKDAADGGTMTTTWLKVNNNVGNSVYWNKEYADVLEVNQDKYGDINSAKFYWQNRLTHAFLALADYNKLTTNTGPTTAEMGLFPLPASAQGKLKMYPYYDKDFVTLSTNPTIEQQAAYDDKLSDNRYANTYDLTRGTRTSIAGQPDPILALTVMKPAGATQEANRVRLYFKHQFSQIQVNIKGADDSSAEVTADQIEGVELLGVSTEGYVCCRLNADGTVGTATAKDVNLDDYTDAQLENNKWGTSFQMFDMATGVDTDQDGKDDGYAIGFLKSYNAIAFGQLWAIRITWHEGTTQAPGIVHVSTFEVPQTNEMQVNLRQLASAMKYVYDLELRRGTLAVIRAEVLNWLQKDALVYGTEGTISN